MAHRRYCTIRYSYVGSFDTGSSSIKEMNLSKSHKTNAATSLDVYRGKAVKIINSELHG